MDPYLEDPVGWPDVHHSLITAIRDDLVERVPPHFHVRIEERVYLTEPDEDPGFTMLVPDVLVTRSTGKTSGEPAAGGVARGITAPVVVADLVDPEIRDAYVEIRDARSHKVVTAIEVLSPANKVHGSRGRQALEEKRRRLRQGGASWLEIDLLRGGERSPRVAGRSDYCVLLLKAGHAGGLAWLFGLRDPLPVVSVPLGPSREDIPLDLGQVLAGCYDRAGYARSVDYSRPVPAPPLSEADAAWARDRLA